MALKIADMVAESSTTTGTGAITLAGTYTGYQTFLAGVGNVAEIPYRIKHATAAEWETGKGTLSSGTTFTRNTISESSNSDAAVNFSAGSKEVILTLPADYMPITAKGADISSASPLVIGTDGGMFDVAGTTNFSVMTVAADRTFILQWDAILTVTHSANIVLPGGANLTTAAGDVWTCYSTAANKVIVTNVATAAAIEASATVKGIVELATIAEVNTGSDTVRAITPAGLTAWTGDTAVVTLGTIGTGTWQGTAIAAGYIAADAITGAKIADDAIDSEHYTDGSIDNAHIADDAIDSEHYAAGSIDTAHIADLQVTTAKIAADAITSAKIADDAIDSEHYTNGSIDTAHYAAGSVDATALGADAVTAAKIGDNVINSEHYAAGSIDNEHIADDAIDSEHYAAGSIDTAHIADDQITLAKLAAGTDGNLISYDTSGNPVAVAAGTDGQVLTSSGAGTVCAFEDAAGGGASSIGGLSDAVTPSSGNDTVGLGTLCLVNDDGSANNNTGLGYWALKTNTTGDDNCGIGKDALRTNLDGFQNTAVGAHALRSNTGGDYNVAVGVGAAYTTTTGTYVVAIGNGASYGNTTGGYSVAIGYQALHANTEANFNVAVGYGALKANVSGADNTAVGMMTGDLTTTGSNNTSLGHDADPTANDASNEVTLGNASISAIRCQVQTISALSDRRDKKDIEELPVGLDFINDLKPVKFVWDMRDGAKVDIAEAGFIAQDLDEAQINAGAEDYLSLVLKNNPDKLEAAYGKLVPILVKAVQELSAEVNDLKEKLTN